MIRRGSDLARRGAGAALAALLLVSGCGDRGDVSPPEAGLPDGAAPAADEGLSWQDQVDTLSVSLFSGADTATVFSDAPSRLLDPATGEVRARTGAWEPWHFVVAGGGVGAWGRWGALERSAGRLRVVPERDGAMVVVGGRPYRGQAEVIHRSDSTLLVANRVEREAYLRSVVASELGDEGLAEPAAARAQAVAARTYAVTFTLLGRRDSLGVDLVADPEVDQSYPGVLVEREAADGAVRATAGEVLTWEGRPARAYYHATCGGRTARPPEAWPGEALRPYLTSVTDRPADGGPDYCQAAPRHRWRRSWSREELDRTVLPAALRAAGPDPDGTPSEGADGAEEPTPAAVRGVEAIDRSEHGRVRELRVLAGAHAGARAPDTLRVHGDAIPHALPGPDGTPLPSTWFRIVPPDSGVALAVEGRGDGHGVGLCQWGAVGRARAGASYREILRAYYPGTELDRLR